MQTNDNTQCMSLISESNDNAEAFILGAPFFRNNIITMNFADEDIGIHSKTVVSPITPTPGPPTPDKPDNGNSNKLSAGAIFGISAGSLFILGILGFVIYKFALPKNEGPARTTSQEFPIEAQETQDLIEDRGPN